MSILPLQITLSVIAFFLYIFFFWRRLKEDYLSQPIFTTAIVVFLSTIILGGIFSFLAFEQLWFWGCVVGFLFSLFLINGKYKFKFFELYEAASRSALILLFFSFINDWLVNSYIYSLYSALVILFLFLLFWYSDNNYRKFSWYKSGRVGFAGLATIGVFFLVRAVAGVANYPVISLLGRIEFILSGVLAFLNFFLLYHLSET